MSSLTSNIVLIPIHSSKHSSFGFFIRAGSEYESKSKQGVAHYLEHVLCAQNTEVDIYAVTHDEYILFQSTQNSEETISNLQRIYTLLFETPLSEEQFTIQRGRIKFELKHYFSINLFKSVYKYIFGTASKQYHGWAGKITDIDKINLKDILKFKDTHFKKENAIVVVVGDFNEAAVLESLKNFLEKPNNASRQSSTKQVQNIVWRTHLNHDTAEVDVFLPIGNMANIKDVACEKILHKCITSGNNSLIDNVLFKELGTAYTVDSEMLRWIDGGVLAFGYKTLPEHAEQTADSVDTVLRNLPTSITEEIFERAKNYAILEHKRMSQDPEQVVRNLGPSILLAGKIDSLEKQKEALLSCTYDEVIKKAKKLSKLPVKVIKIKPTK